MALHLRIHARQAPSLYGDAQRQLLLAPLRHGTLKELVADVTHITIAVRGARPAAVGAGESHEIGLEVDHQTRPLAMALDGLKAGIGRPGDCTVEADPIPVICNHRRSVPVHLVFAGLPGRNTVLGNILFGLLLPTSIHLIPTRHVVLRSVRAFKAFCQPA
jgi:hypothetical protein